MLQSKHDDDFYLDAFAQIGKSIYNDLAKNQFTGFGVYMEILSPDTCSQTTYLPRVHANYDWKIGTMDERKQGAVTVRLQLQATPRLNASMPRRFWEFIVKKDSNNQIGVEITKNKIVIREH